MASTDVCICGDANGIHDPKTGRCSGLKGNELGTLGLLGPIVPCGCFEYTIDRKATWHEDKKCKKANGGKEYRKVAFLPSQSGTMIVKTKDGYVRKPT